jgi:hypothetical protein
MPRSRKVWVLICPDGELHTAFIHANREVVSRRVRQVFKSADLSVKGYGVGRATITSDGEPFHFFREFKYRSSNNGQNLNRT